MSKIYYLSSFDPIVNSDFAFIEDPCLYFPVLERKSEFIFLPFGRENNLSVRQEMIRSVYPSAVFASPLETEEEFLSFVKTLKADEFLVLEEALLKLLIGENVNGFLEANKNILVLKEIHIDHTSYCKMRYLGKDERSYTTSGSYLWTCKPVLDVFSEKGMYFMADVKERVSTHRFLHSLSVAKTAYAIAENNSLDPILCYHAGLLHDIAKDFDREKAIAIMNETYKEYMPCPDFAIHQFIGAYLAKNTYHVPKDVIDMIQFHCTGKAEMTRYMKCLYAADEVEPLREFETEDKRRRCIENLDLGFLYLVRKQVEYFKSKNIDYNEYFLAKQKYDYYLNN